MPAVIFFARLDYEKNCYFRAAAWGRNPGRQMAETMIKAQKRRLHL